MVQFGGLMRCDVSTALCLQAGGLAALWGAFWPVLSKVSHSHLLTTT